MTKFLILSLFLLCLTNVFSVPEVAPLDNNHVPASNLIENLAERTANVTNEVLAQLLAKAENATEVLVGDIDTIITTALNQLKQPIDDFQKQNLSSHCQPIITLEQLNQQIQSDLTKCTQNVQDILNTFQQSAKDFKNILEKSIEEVRDLPKKCKDRETETDFGNSFSCYIDNITDFNKQMGLILNKASETFVHARMLGEQAVKVGQVCANNVIATTKDSLNEMQAACQLIEK